MHRGLLAAVLVVLAFLPGCTDAANPPAAPPEGTGDPGWVGSWATAPVEESGDPWRLKSQSLRMIAHLSLGGSQIRVRLSNAYGEEPVEFGQVRVAKRTEGAAIDPATDRGVSFRGNGYVKIPAGEDVLSDPVPLPVKAGEDLAVSMHVVSAPGGATRHPLALTTHYVAAPGIGDVTGDPGGSQFTSTTDTSYFLTGVDVRAADAGAVVAFGDSITDGMSSIPDTNGRWTDVLARRLGGRGIGVLNAGIAANTVTRTADGPGGGEPAIVRFSRDVLGQSGVRSVVLFEGTNDLAEGVPATELITALRALAAKARAAGLTVVGATILPRSCGPSAWDAASYEPQRLKVNEWIRGSKDFDAVADTDAALRDPQQPRCLHPRYDSGDGLHPNQQGMRKIAEAIPLKPLAANPQ